MSQFLLKPPIGPEIVRALGIHYREWQTHALADQIHLIDVAQDSVPADLPIYIQRF